MTKKKQRVELKRKLDGLAADLVTDPDRLRDFADRWSGGFWPYSFGNLLLIWGQRENATLCAGFQQWKRKGRFVKKGEKAIKILAPSTYKVRVEDPETGEEKEESRQIFYVVNVFDYSQTDGKELNIGHSDKIQGEFKSTVEELGRLFNVPVEVSQGLENGKTDGKVIWISRRENKTAEAATFFHELAHYRLHFNGRGEIPPSQRELEAEAVSFLVCSALGIENEKSAAYISHWKGSRAAIEKSATKVLKTAEEILKTIRPNRRRSEKAAA